MPTVIRPEISKKSQYWLPRQRYYELKHFCLQYPEWYHAYYSLNGLPTRSPGFSERVDGGKMSDPTALYAEARLYYRDRMDMIEQTAKEAAGDLAAPLIKAVTRELSYDVLLPPCGKDAWYVLYRRFFWLLDKARK